MQVYVLSALFLLAVCFVPCAPGQGSFQNSGFESANVPNLPPGQVASLPFTDVLPGWTGYIGDTNQAMTALYNGISLGSPLLSLIGPNTEYYSNNVIFDRYTAALSAGNLPPNPPHLSAAIAQTVTVPGTAESLRFAAFFLAGNPGDLAVTFNLKNAARAPGTSPIRLVFRAK